MSIQNAPLCLNQNDPRYRRSDFHSPAEKEKSRSDAPTHSKNSQQVVDLILRKQTGCSENRVLPHLTMDDLELGLFDEVRKRVQLNKANHLWAMMSNEEILESAGMRLKDQQTGVEGYTLAAALLFGKERTLRSVVPFYKTDALCRRDDSRLYDDRDVVMCNLLRAYERLMDLCGRNLPEWPYIDGVQRKSLRELIMREVCLNMLIHREYGARHDASLTIWKDRIEAVNWNVPFGYGHITLGNLRPHAKNPVIANFFAQLGIVEELGNGTRTMFKYVPLISGGKDPVLDEYDEFSDYPICGRCPSKCPSKTKAQGVAEIDRGRWQYLDGRDGKTARC